MILLRGCRKLRNDLVVINDVREKLGRPMRRGCLIGLLRFCLPAHEYRVRKIVVLLTIAAPSLFADASNDKMDT